MLQVHKRAAFWGKTDIFTRNSRNMPKKMTKS